MVSSFVFVLFVFAGVLATPAKKESEPPTTVRPVLPRMSHTELVVFHDCAMICTGKGLIISADRLETNGCVLSCTQNKKREEERVSILREAYQPIITNFNGWSTSRPPRIDSNDSSEDTK